MTPIPGVAAGDIPNCPPISSPVAGQGTPAGVPAAAAADEAAPIAAIFTKHVDNGQGSRRESRGKPSP